MKSFKEINETRAGGYWSGKPLPKDAQTVSFNLTDTDAGHPKIAAIIPEFTNKKGKALMYGSGWIKANEDILQMKIFTMVTKFLNSPAAIEEIEKELDKIKKQINYKKFGL